MHIHQCINTHTHTSHLIDDLCVKFFSEGVKRAGEGSIKWNEYVLDGVWSSDLYSTPHSHRASVTPSPSGYNKVSQWCSEPRRLAHLRHLSMCAHTPTLPLPANSSSFFLCASCTPPPPSSFSSALTSNFTTFYPLFMQCTGSAES